MKEIYRPIQPELTPIKSELTLQSNPSTLDVRGPRLNRGGNIFMDQGQNEQGPKSENPQSASSGELSQPTLIIQPEKIPTPPAPGQPASQEQIDFAKKTWEQSNIGKELTQEDSEKQKHLIEKGIPYTGGGAERLPIMDYSADPKLQDLVEVLNRAIPDGGGALDPRFIQHYLNELSELRTQGVFTTDEARQQAISLEIKLNSWMVEALDAAKTEQGSGKDEIKAFLEATDEILSDEDFRRIMDSDSPNFDNFPQLEEFIKKYLDPAASLIVLLTSLSISFTSFSENQSLTCLTLCELVLSYSLITALTPTTLLCIKLSPPVRKLSVTYFL